MPKCRPSRCPLLRFSVLLRCNMLLRSDALLRSSVLLRSGVLLRCNALLAWPQDPTAKQGKFGFAVDNTIGGTDQPNGWMEDWVDFFRERRLKHMLRLLNNPRCNQMGQKLCDNLEKLFEGCEVGSLH